MLRPDADTQQVKKETYDGCTVDKGQQGSVFGYNRQPLGRF